jgi:hypothetical protein
MRTKEQDEQSTTRLAAILHLSLVYQAELLSSIQEWDRLLLAVQVRNAYLPQRT